MLKHHRCDVILGEYPSYVLLIIPYILMKFANPVPGCVISGPVRYRISPDLGLNNGL